MNKDNARQLRLIILALAIGIGIFRSCQKQSTPPTPRRAQGTPKPQRTPKPSRPARPSHGGAMPLIPDGQDNSNTLPGMPAPAGKDPNNFLVERPQYAMSYNKDEGEPNWVSWHLDASNLGDVQRGEFRPDPDLPADWQIRPNDYRASGYDRGHVCPSGDRTDSTADNDVTFFMSNMLPQTAALNQHLWKSLEDYSRELANQGNELYICAGGAGSAKRIGHGKVNVPAQCWKVAVVLPEGDGDLSRIDAHARVIAVLMPNEESPQIAAANWSQYTVTPAQVEKTTGYDFFTSVPANVRKALEAKKDEEDTSHH